MSGFATYTGGNRNPRNVILEEELLERIGPFLCIDQFIEQKPVPMKEGDTVLWQRAIVPTNAIAIAAEGVNPTGRTLQYETVQKKLDEYAESYTASSYAVELGQTDIVKDQADVLSDLVAYTRETVGWTAAYGGTNVIYNSAGITSRTGVNGPITAGRLETAVRLLRKNKAKPFVAATKGALQEGTSPIEEGYVCLCHTDCESDIRLLPGFLPAPNVGGGKSVKGWFGTWRRVNFITSPEFKPILAGGAAVGSTGMASAGGVSVDVYPYVIMGKGALGRVGLRGAGRGGYGGVKATTLSGPDKADPTGQRVVTAVRYYDGVVVLQDAHIIRVECGVSNNPVT